jgi:nitroreductase
MDVYEAVTSRRAVRGFTDEPVSREVLERVHSAAAWAPSGSNVQPWRIYVVTGAPLATAEQRLARSAWSQVRKTVDEIVSPPDELMLFCGMSIGYEDPTVNYIRTGRAALDERVTVNSPVAFKLGGCLILSPRPPTKSWPVSPTTANELTPQDSNWSTVVVVVGRVGTTTSRRVRRWVRHMV